MNIDATFWVGISFLIFFGVLIYLKVPQKINGNLIYKINGIKKELEEAEKLKEESKKILDSYEEKIAKSQKEYKNIIDEAKKESENTILEKTKKFHQITEGRKKNIEQKIALMKENALKEIRNVSIKISLESVGHLIKNSIDKSKVEKFYSHSLEQIKTELKDTTKA